MLALHDTDPLAAVRRRSYEVSLAVRYYWSTPSVLLVLGMHRSGTGCVSRMLGLMGAELGSVSGDADAEPGGEARENPRVDGLNEDLLARSGHSWQSPPSEVQASRRDVWRCRRAVWEFGGSRMAVIRDPRMLFTYPVWREALRDHSLVACLRHPLSVARSLERHHGLPIAEGLNLWHTCNLQLLERTTAGRRVYWFDFDNGEASSRRLIRQLEKDFPLSATGAALSYFRPADRHHQEKGRLPGRVADLYDVLRFRARLGR